MRVKTTFEIDGRDFSTLEEFYDVISRTLIPGAIWGHNLDAFDDILRGGFGTPNDGFVLRWRNSELSRLRLGYPETIRQLESRLSKCHPANRKRVAAELEAARNRVGPTVFDWLLGIIRDHGEGGSQSDSNVALVLE